MKKIFALDPAEREKECTVHFWSYKGQIPCTGEIRCSMCGLIKPRINK